MIFQINQEFSFNKTCFWKRINYLSLFLAILILYQSGSYYFSSFAKNREQLSEQIHSGITLNPLGYFKHGDFAKRASEYAVYDKKNYQLIVTNRQYKSLDILTIKNPKSPILYKRISLEEYGIPSSIALHGSLIALTLLNSKDITQNGLLIFLNTDHLEIEKIYKTNPSPYSVTFTHNGKSVIVVNQGEPDEFLVHDPTGSISLFSTEQMEEVENTLSQKNTNIQTITFEDFNNTKIEGASFSFPGASFTEAIQPETIALYPNQNKAIISLQANNAIAILDLNKKEITQIIGLGYKSWFNQKIDISDQDGKINLQTWPIYSLYQPDGLAVYKDKKENVYWVTANEGKMHNYKGYISGERVHNLMLDYKAFPKSRRFQDMDQLGRLKVNVKLGDEDGDGDYDALYTFGARSISIWSETGERIWDSGSMIEEFLAQKRGKNGFNASHDNNIFDQRSDDKGAEPENIILIRLNNRIYAFVGLERDSSIMIFDITTPETSFIAGYATTRNFKDSSLSKHQDLGVEGLLYIPAKDSPNKKPLLITCNEISSTTRLYEIIVNDSNPHR